ncbi:MAG: hypothetical protein ACYDD6_03835, partial [Acidimicrobiales bacterium]
MPAMHEGTSPASTSPVPSPATPGPGPWAIFYDLTWISTTHGWALARGTGCTGARCTAVLNTTDGGSSWQEVGSIPAELPNCPGGCQQGLPEVSHIRFANYEDGYAFSPNLFVTSNGGITWTEEQGPMVLALEPAGSDVVRVSYTHTGCPGPCNLRVEQAPPGSGRWSALTSSFRGDSVLLVRQGADEIYVAALENPAGGAIDEHASLLISHDGGSTWAKRADPCGNLDGKEYDTTTLAAAPGRVVVDLCSARAQYSEQFVAESTDGGGTFTMGPLVSPSGPYELIAATSAPKVFLGAITGGSPTETYSLLGSDDGGHSWRTAASQTGHSELDFPYQGFLGFESASVGRWAGYPYVIW